jgi:predicted N-acetyltransferase YhbS
MSLASASPLVIDAEQPFDAAARERLLDAAFGRGRRGKTSERLREGRQPAAGLAFVARQDGAVVGTLRLWTVSAGPAHPALLLGPLAVSAGMRGGGLGGALMRTALLEAASRGHRAILLVGDHDYYARFGFRRGLTDRLWLPGPVERDRFLAHEIVPGALDGAVGLVTPTGRMAEVAAFAAAA